MSNKGDKSFLVINESQAVCVNCRYFREKDGSIGYCNCHHVYVLRDFDCQKFLLKEKSVTDGNRGSCAKEVVSGKR
jgi:hypothetical protein